MDFENMDKTHIIKSLIKTLWTVKASHSWQAFSDDSEFLKLLADQIKSDFQKYDQANGG
jgi:hypothetical protein